MNDYTYKLANHVQVHSNGGAGLLLLSLWHGSFPKPLTEP